MDDGGRRRKHLIQEDIRRFKGVRGRGMHYVDVGTSAGFWGLNRGYCLTLGGDPKVVEQLDPISSARLLWARRNSLI